MTSVRLQIKGNLFFAAPLFIARPRSSFELRLIKFVARLKICSVWTGGRLEVEPQQLLPGGLAGDRQRARGGRSDVHIVARAPPARTAVAYKLQFAGTPIRRTYSFCLLLWFTFIFFEKRIMPRVAQEFKEDYSVDSIVFFPVRKMKGPYS